MPSQIRREGSVDYEDEHEDEHERTIRPPVNFARRRQGDGEPDQLDAGTTLAEMPLRVKRNYAAMIMARYFKSGAAAYGNANTWITPTPTSPLTPWAMAV